MFDDKFVPANIVCFSVFFVVAVVVVVVVVIVVVVFFNLIMKCTRLEFI